MANMSVDTLSIARDLRAAELPQPQAEAIASAIGQSIADAAATTADLGQLRTEVKSDFVQLRTEVKSEIAQLRSEVKSDIADLKSTMMTWFIGTILTLAAIMIAAIKL